MCAEVLTKIRCGRRKIALPPADARVYRDAAAIVLRLQVELKSFKPLLELQAKRSQLSDKAHWARFGQEGIGMFEMRGRLDGACSRLEAKLKTTNAAVDVIRKDFNRRKTGMLQYFVNQFPGMDHDKAWRYWLEKAGFESWTDLNDAYPEFGDYPLECWAAWLHKEAHDGLRVHSGYYGSGKAELKPAPFV